MAFLVGGLIGMGVGAVVWYLRRKSGTDADADADADADSHRGRITTRCEAKPHSRPYMAYLQIQRGASYTRCSGFLVSENFVLTAAHCEGDKITVILGAHNIGRKEENQQHITVRRQIPHPQYDRKTLKNNIMLLQLEKPAKLNRFVKTIALPETGEVVKPGMECSVAGWGLTIVESKSSSANVLREVDMVVLDDGECSQYDNYHPATMLRAGNPQKCGNSTNGDSGGPLVCNGKAQGIVSRGSMDGMAPGTYTRVSAFIDWIRNEMSRPRP